MKLSVEQALASRIKLYELNRTRVRHPSYKSQYGQGPRDTEFISEIFHEASKIKEDNQYRLNRSTDLFTSGMMTAAVEALEVDYPKSETVDLPDPSLDEVSLEDALKHRRSIREYATDKSVTLQEIATVLGFGAGRSGELLGGEGRVKSLRSYPSPGGLYPTEIYPVVFDVDGLDAGVYYYNPDRHVLRLLERADDEFREDVIDRTDVSDDLIAWDTVDMMFLFMGSLWRSRAKYGPRGYRFLLQETGHLAQNLLLIAAALDLGTVPLGGFDDDALSELLGGDGVEDAVMYLLPVGKRQDPEDRDEIMKPRE